MMPIHPNEVIRLKDGPTYFGFGPTQIDAKIKTGEIPPPLSLSASGRARGWLGSQIIEHQAKLQRRNQTAA
jgi:predicted DNA-binding transcriptional regulator AlpA